MRKVLVLVLALFLVLVCSAAQAAGSAVLDNEGQRDCVMEAGTHAREHHAILFKSGDMGVSTPARAQTARGVEIPEGPVCFGVLSGVRSFAPSRVSRQTVTQQNIVERK